MNDINFKKYLKYKKKYLELKYELKGGADDKIIISFDTNTKVNQKSCKSKFEKGVGKDVSEIHYLKDEEDEITTTIIRKDLMFII